MKYFWLFLCSLSLLNNNTLSISNLELEFHKSLFNQGDLVFDVGANGGYKTEIYLALGAKVICIEPQPECCEKLYNQFGSRITIEQKGAASKKGFANLHLCTSNPISTFSDEWRLSGRFKDSHIWNKTITVEMTTLDDLIHKYGIPQFCKIDVENYEYEVLKGLSFKIPNLSFEFAIEMLHNSEKCIQHLVSLGYNSFNFSIAERNKLELEQWVEASEIISKIKDVKTFPIDDLWGDIYAKC